MHDTSCKTCEDFSIQTILRSQRFSALFRFSTISVDSLLLSQSKPNVYLTFEEKGQSSTPQRFLGCKTHRILTLLERAATTQASWRRGQRTSPYSVAVDLTVFPRSTAAFSARGWRAQDRDRRPSAREQRGSRERSQNGLPRLPCNCSPMQRLTNDEQNTRKKKPARLRRKPAGQPTRHHRATANGTQREERRKREQARTARREKNGRGSRD